MHSDPEPLDVTVVVLGPPEYPSDVLREVCADIARVTWSALTDQPGSLAIAVINDIPMPRNAAGFLVFGAYSPKTQMILLFPAAMRASRRPGSVPRKLVSALAHEVAHGVQYVRDRSPREDGKGSALLGPAEYAEDRLEKEAKGEALALDDSLYRRPNVSHAISDRYVSGLSAALRSRMQHLETLEGVSPDPGALRAGWWAWESAAERGLSRFFEHCERSGRGDLARGLTAPLKSLVGLRLGEVEEDALWSAVTSRTEAGSVSLADTALRREVTAAVDAALHEAWRDFCDELTEGGVLYAARPSAVRPEDVNAAESLAAFREEVLRELPLAAAARRALLAWHHSWQDAASPTTPFIS